MIYDSTDIEMKSTLTILAAPILFLYSMALYAESVGKTIEDSLNMECTPVTGQQGHLCTVITDSP